MPRLRLSQALTLDEFGDLGHELGLDKHGLRIRHADISVDVSAARLDLDRMHGFTFPHGAYSFAADSAAFNLYPNRYNRQDHALRGKYFDTASPGKVVNSLALLPWTLKEEKRLK